MEILAHASAPSSKKDDERFKRQALAYSSFKVAASISVLHRKPDNAVERSTRKDTKLKTPVHATRLDPTLYLDDTQLAYSALESQLITSSVVSVDNDESEDEEDEEVTPRPARNVSDVLLPNESSDVDVPLSSSRHEPPSPAPVSLLSHGQGNLLSSPSARLRARQDLTLGYIGGISTADVWATPSRPLPIVPQGIPQPHPQEPSSSSPGDDLPSQLPSTYSLSDVDSDNHSNHDAIERLLSSPWVDLPRGTASQKDPAKADVGSNRGRAGQLTSSPWEDLPRGTASQTGSANADSESNHGIAGQYTSSPREDLPRGTAPENDQVRGPPSGRGDLIPSHRANMSVPIQPSSSRNGVTSYSLDRACNPLSKQSQGRAPRVSFLKSKGALSSQNRIKPLQQESKSQTWYGPDAGVSSPSIHLPESSPPNHIPENSSPVHQSPEVNDSDPDDAAKGLLISHVTPANPSATSKTRLHLPSSVPSIDFPGSSTPISKPPPQVPSSVTSRVPETNLASKKRKYTEFSTPKSLPKPEDVSKLKTLSTHITPGPPATSSERFVTHITPYLRTNYFDKPELENRYVPTEVTRELRPSERGHWLVDPSSWALELQLRFWNFLEKQIGMGKAGWGIWVVRGEDSTSQDKDEVEVGGKIVTDLGTVRVFCWGEVVAHVYLLLYVASGSKVRKVEPCWVDAGGEVVVRI